LDLLGRMEAMREELQREMARRQEQMEREMDRLRRTTASGAVGRE
jgi:hypothetical protein